MRGKQEHAGELKVAKSVLSKSVLGPQMKAIRRLVNARDAAANPEGVRESARLAAREVLDRARREGDELREKAERDISTAEQDWRDAYRECLVVGWTDELLAAAGQPAPPSGRKRGRRAARRQPESGRAAEAGRRDPAGLRSTTTKAGQVQGQAPVDPPM